MRLIFIRHGDPNYALDCLTELGVRQAEAVSFRLENEQIDKIYSSTMGRAVETATATADRLGLPILERLSFMDERWAPTHTFSFAHPHPWAEADALAEEGLSLFELDPQKTEWFGDAARLAYDQEMRGAFDNWLATLGYKREGQYYRCVKENNDVIALFSHAGSSSRVMAHLMNLPFVYFCHMFRLAHTSICIFDFGGSSDTLVTPKARLMNDSKHITAIQ